MPNTNKPARKRAADEEEEEESSIGDDKSNEDHPNTSYSHRPTQGGGKQLRAVPTGGGKMLRMPSADDDDDDEEEEDDDDDDDESSSNGDDHYAVTTQIQQRSSVGGGKQLRMPSGGKQLRMAPQEEEEESDDDDDDSEEQESSEDDEEDQQQQTKVAVTRHGGGKSLANMRPQPPQEDSDDQSSSEEEKERLQPRPVGGGKSLANIQRSRTQQLVAHRQQREHEGQSSDDDDDDEEDEEVAQPPSSPRSNGVRSSTSIQPSRGKQLTLPPQKHQQHQQSSSESSEEDVNYSETSDTPAHLTAQMGGKMLRPQGGEKNLRLPAHSSASTGPPAGAEGRKEPMFSDADESDNTSKIQQQKLASVSVTASSAGGIISHDAKKQDDADSMEMSSSGSSSDEEIGVAPWATTTRIAPPKDTLINETREEDTSSEQSSSSDEEEELDVDKMDPAELIKGVEDQKYLHSLPEFEREAILGERFEKLKNERDMKKALKDAKRQERERKKVQKAQKTTMTGKKTATSAVGRKKKDTATAAMVAAAVKNKILGKDAAEEEMAAAKETALSDEEEEMAEQEDLETDQALVGFSTERKGSARSRETSSVHEKKAAARAAIREERLKKQEQDGNNNMDTGESEDELDYGSSDDDSDEDYAARPWGAGAVKKDNSKINASKEAKWRDPAANSDASEKEEEETEKSSRPIIEATYEDYKMICLPRRRLARWCNEPFFDKAVVNSYIRLGIGADEQTKKMVYRFCKILGVERKQRYSFVKPPGQKKATATAKWLKVEFGNHIKFFRMITISDSLPEEGEVLKYVHQLKNSRKQVLSKSQARLIRNATLDTVNNYQYTKDDIDRVVEEKKKSMVARNIGLEKTRIDIEVQAAREALAEATEKLAELQSSLSGSDACESKILIAQSDLTEAKKKIDLVLAEEQRIFEADEMRKRKIMRSSKVQNWVKVSQRAKEKNRAADYLSYKDHAKHSHSFKEFDPFARRKVKPDILWDVGQGKDKEISKMEAEKMLAENASNMREQATAEIVSAAHNGGKENKKKMDFVSSQKELLGKRHQFAIDEEVLARTSRLSGADVMSSSSIRRERIRRGLSLAEYQARKASGTL